MDFQVRGLRTSAVWALAPGESLSASGPWLAPNRLIKYGRIRSLPAARQRFIKRLGDRIAGHWLCAHPAEEGTSSQDHNDCVFRSLCDFSGELSRLPRERRKQAFSKVGTTCGEDILFFHPVAARTFGGHRAVPGGRNNLPWVKRSPHSAPTTGKVDFSDLVVRFDHWSPGIPDALPVFPV